MNVAEAREIQRQKMSQLRQRSYEDLCRLLRSENIEWEEILGASGQRYQLKSYALWDDQRGGDLRVWVDIDDGGWRSVCPLTDNFIMAPDGSFVGE
jgi:hypothetical protein